jgi:hypothetical protein
MEEPLASGSQSGVLFENVRIFDGKESTLSSPSNVLIRDNTIERISTSIISVEPSVRVVAGGGRTLMPGLIDAHTHMTFSTIPLPLFFSADPNYLMLRQGQAAGEMLALSPDRASGHPVPESLRPLAMGIFVHSISCPAPRVIRCTSLKRWEQWPLPMVSTRCSVAHASS